MVSDRIATQDYVDAAVAGVVAGGAETGDLTWSARAAKTGWLICDGAAVSRATYAALFAEIGVKFGVGDGSTTFNVPNTEDRLLYGAGGSKVVGDTGGAATHVHATSGITVSAHTHALTGGTSTASASSSSTPSLSIPDHYHFLGQAGGDPGTGAAGWSANTHASGAQGRHQRFTGTPAWAPTLNTGNGAAAGANPTNGTTLGGNSGWGYWNDATHIYNGANIPVQGTISTTTTLSGHTADANANTVSGNTDAGSSLPPYLAANMFIKT